MTDDPPILDWPAANENGISQDVRAWEPGQYVQQPVAPASIVVNGL